jgi:phosphohistidine phosphatase
MKTLLILRHGKTQQYSPRGDHARELTERGRRNSRTMGEYIRGLTGTPDAIITSDAVRSVQTAEIVAPATGFTGELTIDPRIYEADLPTLLALVLEIPNDVAIALLVGHNPGFEELSGALAGIDPDDVRLPTAGLAHVEFDDDAWDRAFNGSGRLRGIMTPKLLAEAAS